MGNAGRGICGNFRVLCHESPKYVVLRIASLIIMALIEGCAEKVEPDGLWRLRSRAIAYGRSQERWGLSTDEEKIAVTVSAV